MTDPATERAAEPRRAIMIPVDASIGDLIVFYFKSLVALLAIVVAIGLPILVWIAWHQR